MSVSTASGIIELTRASDLPQECDGKVSLPMPDSSLVCLGSMMPSALAAF